MSDEELPPPFVAAALCSGAAALFYESLWARSLALVLGSTVQANAIVFGSFLVGLALGAFVFARSPRARADMAATYVVLEGAIAVSAPLAGLLLGRYADTLSMLAGGHGAPFRIVRAFLTTLAVVVVPTSFMGGTFPMLIALASAVSARPRAVARIYAVNTAGAALGALACGVFTIGLYGVTVSYAIAASLNLAAVGFIFLLGPRPLAGDVAPPASQREPGAASLDPSDSLALSLAALASGAVVLAVEVVFSRLSSYFLGNRTVATIILLSWVLVLLAVGAALVDGAPLFRRVRIRTLLAGAFGASAFGLSISTGAVAWWLEHQTAVESQLPGIRALALPYRWLETGILLAPALVPLACVLPSCLVGVRAASGDVARGAGALYAINTAGAVVGSLVTGGWAFSAVGSYGWIRLLSVACLGVAFLIYAAAPPRRRTVIAAGLIAAAVSVALAWAVVPRELTFVTKGERLLRRVEDEYGVFQITEQSQPGVLRVTNNRTALVNTYGTVDTRFVQEMQAHLAMWFLPGAKNVVVLGSGYGITAGAFGLYQTVAHVDAVEILPAMVDAAPLFAADSHHYDENPKIAITVDDARHFLATRAASYDIVSINISDPHLPGSSALLHADFYEIVKRHLLPHGVVVQHAFGDDIDVALRTMAVSFPYLRLYRSYQNGMNVVASSEPLAIEDAAVSSLVEREPVATALRRIGFASPLTPSTFAARGFVPRDFPEYFAPSVPIATDDRPRLEYSTRGGPNALLFSNQ